VTVEPLLVQSPHHHRLPILHCFDHDRNYYRHHIHHSVFATIIIIIIMIIIIIIMITIIIITIIIISIITTTTSASTALLAPLSPFSHFTFLLPPLTPLRPILVCHFSSSGHNVLDALSILALVQAAFLVMRRRKTQGNDNVESHEMRTFNQVDQGKNVSKF
jgi:hypothetical protein